MAQDLTTLRQTSLAPVPSGDSQLYSVSVCAVVCPLKGIFTAYTMTTVSEGALRTKIHIPKERHCRPKVKETENSSRLETELRIVS